MYKGLDYKMDHEAVLINNYVRVGGTIFYWESDNPNKTFPVICLDLWKYAFGPIYFNAKCLITSY